MELQGTIAVANLQVSFGMNGHNKAVIKVTVDNDRHCASTGYVECSHAELQAVLDLCIFGDEKPENYALAEPVMQRFGPLSSICRCIP